MTRTTHDGSILIVEGVHDLRFWSVWKDTECELVCGEGKPNVEEAISDLEQEGITGVLGIVDDDYDSILRRSLNSKNLVSTDAHDLECLLCRSEALNRVLAELGDARKIIKLEKSEGGDVRVCLIRRAVVFGKVRLACMLVDVDVDVKAINVARFLDKKTWSVDGEGLMKTVSKNCSATDKDKLAKCIERLDGENEWYIVSGHDLVRVLRIGLQQVIGNIPASIGAKQIERLLRSGVPRADLESSGLFHNIRKWESANFPYRLCT